MTEAALMAVAQQVYVGSLFVICAIAVVHSWADLKAAWKLLLVISPIRRTAAVLFANWTINTAFVLTFKIYDPWAWYIATDTLSAAIVLYRPAGKPQSMIGGLYMAQIVMHCVYGALEISRKAIAENSYWQVLTALAFVQLLVLGGWASVHHWRRIARSSRGRRGASLAGAPSKKSVDR